MSNLYKKCLVTLFFLAIPGWSQTAETGAISGTVHDPSGAVVVGAAVELANVGTGLTRTFRTDNRGTFLAGLLPPGDYSLNVTAQGFQKVVVTGVHVQVTEV